MENTIDSLFIKRQEEIHLTKEEQEKILNESKIYLHSIIDSIQNEDLQKKLLQYEEQNNKLQAIYDEIFYKQGFHDALTLGK